MIRNYFRFLLTIVGVLLIACAVGLFVMAGVAATHDVERVSPPASSFLASVRSDHEVAFKAPMEYDTYRDIDRLAQFTAHRGLTERYRDARELVYEGSLPGATYLVSFVLMRDKRPNTLTMTTAFTLHGSAGRYLWFIYRPVYRFLGAYLLDRVVENAPD